MVQPFSVWPCAACVAVAYAVAALPPLRVLDRAGGGRFTSIDGLRGLLALAVVVHHAVMWRGYLATGRWGAIPAFHKHLGEAGVALFFMITALLFWRKLANERAVRWGQLYLGRVFRIGPLYLCAVAAMFAIVAWQTGFRLQVPAPDLVKQIVKWSLLGLYGIGPDVNGLQPTMPITAGVTWTLQFEWWFYLSLPVLAPFARRAWRYGPVLAGMAVCAVLLATMEWRFDAEQRLQCAFMFLTGILAACLLQDRAAVALPDRVASVLVVSLLGAVLAWPSTAYAPAPVLLMGIAFLLLGSGCTMFGLLVTRPARRLGEISYGLYLMHGLLLYAAFANAGVQAAYLGSAWLQWLGIAGFVALAILAATVLHLGVEQPGIALGRRLGAVLRRREPVSG